MELLNNILVALTTKNEALIKILSVPLSFIEVTVTMFLFTTLLKITSTKNQKLIYVLVSAILSVSCTFFIPKPYSNIITFIAMPFIIMIIFKVSFLKSVLAEFIPVIIITILEMIIAKFCFVLFNKDYQTCAYIPLFRIPITGCIYFSLFLLYKLCKNGNLNITVLDKITKKNKFIIIVNILIALIVLFMQMYLIVYYNDKMPLFIVIINILSLIAYFSLSIYSMVKTMTLEETQADLEQEKLYNKTLQILHDNIRAFKHDFSNIISGIGGYVETNDMNGLKKYYKQLLQDCNQVSNLGSLNPEVVNSPAVYSILANKYYKADSLGIKINLESFIDFNNLHMEIYEFTRILGILMDNAIEASSECVNKLINVVIRNDPRQNRQLLIIENTYKDKNVDTDKIYQKGYSTKKTNTGLGLWEVEKIIKKHKNLARFTSKTDEFFKQQLEIYNE